MNNVKSKSQLSVSEKDEVFILSSGETEERIVDVDEQQQQQENLYHNSRLLDNNNDDSKEYTGDDIHQQQRQQEQEQQPHPQPHPQSRARRRDSNLSIQSGYSDLENDPLPYVDERRRPLTTGGVSSSVGGVGSLLGLPHAYPVNPNSNNNPTRNSSSSILHINPDPNDIIVQRYVENNNNDDVDNNNNNKEDDECDKKLLCCTNKKNICIYTIWLIFFSSLIYLSYFIIDSNRSSIQQVKEEKDESNEEEEENQPPPIIVSNNNTTTTTKMEESNLNTTMFSSSDNESQSQSEESTQDDESIPCIVDPWIIHLYEWEYFQTGGDLSIPRTYHFCPNSIMRIYDMDPLRMEFIYPSGDYHPLFLFAPNVNILCGEDGDFSNNCTFSGGLLHVSFFERPLFVTYSVNTTCENITMSGFRFTGASDGTIINMRNKKSSLLLRNCRFDHNYDMMASIYLTASDVLQRSLTIENCTFESSSYRFHNYEGYSGTQTFYPKVPNIGVILSSPPHHQIMRLNNKEEENHVLMNNKNNPKDMEISVQISNSLFFNNTFITASASSDHVVTLAVINMLSPISRLEITETCFIANTNYTSGLILLHDDDEGIVNSTKEEDDDEKDTQFYFGNYFSEETNVASDLYNSSCILNYQETSHLIIKTVDGESGNVVISKPQPECHEYVDEGVRKETSDNFSCFAL